MSSPTSSPLFTFLACPWKNTFFFFPKKKEEAQIKNERIQNNPQFLTHVSLTVSSTTHTSASTRHPPNSAYAEDIGGCYEPKKCLGSQSSFVTILPLGLCVSQAFSVLRRILVPSEGPLAAAILHLHLLSTMMSKNVPSPTPSTMLFNTRLC